MPSRRDRRDVRPTQQLPQPGLAEAMKALGYVNRFGYGIQRAKAAMDKNGNAPIHFEVDDRTFLDEDALEVIWLDDDH